MRSVEPFDINDIKVTSKNYDADHDFCVVAPEDEEEVLKWVSESVNDLCVWCRYLLK